MNRLSVCIAVIACLSPLAAQADRITTMTREEKCVYVARLQVAAAFYYTQGQRRDEVKIHWHGDDSQRTGVRHAHHRSGISGDGAGVPGGEGGHTRGTHRRSCVSVLHDGNGALIPVVTP
ncbi:MAG: hypothetical protein IPK20_19895 [Betaproteobacteria bacterium]|nr:hypothetical protein [Betaproteobacteria bacterium]